MELSSPGLCSQLKPSLTVQHYRQGHVNTLASNSSCFILLTWVSQAVGCFFLWSHRLCCWRAEWRSGSLVDTGIWTGYFDSLRIKQMTLQLLDSGRISPPFLYSYESKMHAFIKWIWGLLSKHKTFLSRALITNLQYFCHKLTWKTSLSEALALDDDRLWSVCVWQGMLWKETRHAGLKTEASQGGRGKLKKKNLK